MDDNRTPVPYILGMTSFLTAIRRGLRGRCPKCGEGKMFRAFLKVADACPHCGEDFTPQRADDMPAWLDILVVGHILVPLVAWVEMTYHPEPWVHMALWIPITLILSISFLQPIKGGIVALQWHMGYGDFAAARKARLGQD